MTFITEGLAQTLRAKRIRMPIEISAVGRVNAGTYRHAALVRISPRGQSTPAFSTTALILRTLTAYAPKHLSADSSLSHLSDLSWADRDPMSTDPISIIIGADLYGEMLVDGLRKGRTGQPIAQNTALGWIISGSLNMSTDSAQTDLSASKIPPAVRRVNAHHCLDSVSLDQELRRFWELEEIPRPHTVNPLDEQCEQHFCATHSRDADGRYVVRLPFKTGPPIDIGQSRVSAERMLRCLHRRFLANPEQKREYEEFIHEYARLHHMREVPAQMPPSSQIHSSSRYIPAREYHHSHVGGLQRVQHYVKRIVAQRSHAYRSKAPT